MRLSELVFSFFLDIGPRVELLVLVLGFPGGGASLIAQLVKSLPAVQETQVQSLGWEDPLEKGIAAHSSILAWRIPWTEEPGGLQSMGSRRGREVVQEL